MSTLIPNLPFPSSPEPQPRLWTVEEYQRMATLGLLAPNERTELIEGKIIEKRPPEPIHTSAVNLARLALARAFDGEDAFVQTENPTALPGSQPQPDVEVLTGGPRRYAQRHPLPEDVLLVVEIANTSLTYDKEVKAPLYAAAGIGEYWIINVNARTVEVHRNPQKGKWTQKFNVPETGQITPLASPHSVVLVADLLP